MKNPIRILAALMIVAALAVTYGCKDDDPTPLSLSTITVGGADLNGSASPTGVATNASIEVNFSTAVDASTATASNIKLTRDYDKADIPLTITTDGSKITITPQSALDAGNVYVLSVSDALTSDKGLALTALTRTFTTAGFFAPSGQAAYWMFESNGNDALGTYNSNNAIDVSYADGRNAASGKAASFNGTTSILEIPNGDDFLDANSFTLSMWVKADASNTHGHFVLGVGGFTGFQYEIAQDMSSAKLAAQYKRSDLGPTSEDLWWNGENNAGSNGGFVGWTFAKDVGGADGVKAILTDKWVHIVTTFNTTTKIGTMYFNGDKVKEFDFTKYDNDKKTAFAVTFNGNTAAPGNDLVFGFLQSSSVTNRSLGDDWAAYENENNNHFKGQLDDVRIFKRAITADEVSRIYQSEKP
jgi:hypothetical protein